MRGRDLVKKTDIILRVVIAVFSILPKRFSCFLYVHSRNIKGMFGIFLRYVLIKRLAKSCGNNVCIKENVYLFNINNLVLGNNVSIHPMCYIDAMGGISIGDNVSIAHNCSLISFNHTYSIKDIPIKYNPCIKGSINIGNDVWIGCGVRILANVYIGNRVVIGAGTIVTKSIDSNTLSCGVPCRKIKEI